MKSKKKIKTKENYVSNKEFSDAIIKYLNSVAEAKKQNKPEPKIPEYIGECILKIANGISSRPNFSKYSYKDEMVMDAVENCISSISKFDIEAVTKSGAPNAFAYFSQICWYAFLRRIHKEKKQQEIKETIILNSLGKEFVELEENNENSFLGVIEKIKNKKEQSMNTLLDGKTLSKKTFNNNKKLNNKNNLIEFFSI